jgi:DNA-binding SARP family transcriptional activator
VLRSVVGRTHPGAGSWYGGATHLQLLGSFALTVDGSRVEIASAGQRLFALLGLLGGRGHRSQVAGELWPDQSEPRALSNLRSAMWRMPAIAQDVIVRSGAFLMLCDSLSVDLDEAAGLARRLLSAPPTVDTAMIDRELLMMDLLPGFDEGWLIVPREQHRQRRLHALEILVRNDLDHDRPLDAVDVALAAVAAEPLRESAQLLLVRAHLAAGNRAAARDQFHRFRDLLATELDVSPSAELALLMKATTARPVTPL